MTGCDTTRYTKSFPQISLHALSGVNTYQTMRIRGYVGKQPLHILIDYGSTHNFLDVSIAKKLPCQLIHTTPLRVDVANGSKMVSSSECKQFKLTLQGYEYEADCMLLPLGGCDMGKQVFTEGQWKQAQLASMIVYVYLTQLMQIQREAADTSDNNLPLQHLLSKDADVFYMHTKLPPQRTKDHAITLIPNTPPITVRPYRLPPNQKDVVEQMVKELLDAGVIRESQSPFSSPIVMVKKKDGTWRMCVDYRQLNKFTVKDKFPIPMVEELIDELCGARIFSKLDLRFGYHQIRMKEEDVYKTAFRTYQGLEAKKLKNLTNAPSTFQSLMNQVFKPFLWKFVLVFFDDILIYSANEEDRLQHLQAVLEVMRANTLRFIKNYAIISQPLTKLLRKNGFHWSTEAEVAFNQLKHAMTNTLVLALPNFEKEFMVEIDASGSGILGSYDGLRKEISYKKGADNGAANALLRCPELNPITTTTVTIDLLKRIQDSWIQDKSLHSLIQKLQVNPNTPSKFECQSNQLTRRGKLVMGDVPELKIIFSTMFMLFP
ncbi:reverse transcriptase [Tanacetum coccineum]